MRFDRERGRSDRSLHKLRNEACTGFGSISAQKSFGAAVGLRRPPQREMLQPQPEFQDTGVSRHRSFETPEFQDTGVSRNGHKSSGGARPSFGHRAGAAEGVGLDLTPVNVGAGRSQPAAVRSMSVTPIRMAIVRSVIFAMPTLRVALRYGMRPGRCGSPRSRRNATLTAGRASISNCLFLRTKPPPAAPAR